MLGPFIPSLVLLSAACIHISSCVDTSLLYWPDPSHEITFQLSDELWDTGAKARAGAVSKLLVQEQQFVISNGLILVRAKSDISGIANSMSVTEGSGKCWIVLIWCGWRFLFFLLCLKCRRWSNFNPIWLFISVSPGVPQQAEHACSAMGQREGNREKG